MYTEADLAKAVKVMVNGQQYDPVKSRSMTTRTTVRKWDPLVLQDGNKVYDTQKQLTEPEFLEICNNSINKVEIIN